MTPTNQLPEKKPDDMPAPAGADLASVTPDRTFTSESELEAAIAEQPKPPKKVTVDTWRAGPVEEVATYPRWLKRVRNSALVVQILGAFATGYTGARKFFEWTGISEMSFWDIARAAWGGIRKLIGFAA